MKEQDDKNLDNETNDVSDRDARKAKIKKEAIEYLKAIVTALVLAFFIITFVARSFRVDGMSMEPSLHNGERVMVNKVLYHFAQPQRGDVVVFPYPLEPKNMFIKRVIGVPGDEVKIRDGITYINDVAIEEPYIYAKSFNDYGPVVVPEGRVFVMGDNRNNSLDSRSTRVGMIPINKIEGRVEFVYWPLNKIRLSPKYRDYPAEIDANSTAYLSLEAYF